MAWPLSKDARPQAAKGDAVQLAATTPTQMWPEKKMEGCGEKRPQKCGSRGTRVVCGGELTSLMESQSFSHST